jgi:hypothetical protein
MTKKELRSVEERADVIAGRILEKAVGDYLVFLDCGAILDIEKDVMRRAKLDDSSASPSRFYTRLNERTFPIFVTDHIFSELITHHKSHTLCGNPEVSAETFELVSEMHKKYCDFLRGVDGGRHDSEQVRYHAYWAGQLAFKEGHKKKCRDPISRNDRELVASALWARYAFEEIDSSDVRIEYDSAVIVSPDCHVSGASEFLMERPEFDYTGLSVISSRG